MHLTQSPNFVREKTVPICKYMGEGTMAMQTEIIFLPWKRDSPPLQNDWWNGKDLLNKFMMMSPE